MMRCPLGHALNIAENRLCRKSEGAQWGGPKEFLKVADFHYLRGTEYEDTLVMVPMVSVRK